MNDKRQTERPPVFLWLGLRILTVLTAILAYVYDNGGWAGKSLRVLLTEPWYRYDTFYYLRIVSAGYQAGDVTAGFHPLHPWLATLAAAILRSPIAGLMFISTIAGLGLTILFYKLARVDLEHERAWTATALMLCWPVTAAIFVPYTEALYLLLAVSCILASLQWAQWSPLIVASAFLPALMFVSVIKPNVAGPVVLLHWRVIGIITSSILLICSLIIYPTWPIKWLSQLSQYEGYIPLLTIPGPLLLLALTRRRERDAQFLLVASIFPQRWFYDVLILWLIPKTRKEFLYSVTFSWGAYFWRLYHLPETRLERGLVVTLFFYLPMLFIILTRKREETRIQESSGSQKLEEITSGAPQ